MLKLLHAGRARASCPTRHIEKVMARACILTLRITVHAKVDEGLGSTCCMWCCAGSGLATRQRRRRRHRGPPWQGGRREHNPEHSTGLGHMPLPLVGTAFGYSGDDATIHSTRPQISELGLVDTCTSNLQRLAYTANGFVVVVLKSTVRRHTTVSTIWEPPP